MPRAKLTIHTAACKGCALCAAVCPRDILAPDKSLVNAKGYSPIQCTSPDACTACAICAIICPDSAIKVERV